jgi:hydroxymethylpyrimidine pyrophosphatase-like HAD family hydrolase
VIAAGDDENDISLLMAADTKIAMAHAPESLQQVATFIAPPTKDQGIIKALQMALRNAR